MNRVKKRPQKVVVVGIIRSDRQKCPIIFVEANEKTNRLVHNKLLDRHVIPRVKVFYPEGKFVFQQDKAPSHNAAAVQAKLNQELGGARSRVVKQDVTFPVPIPQLARLPLLERFEG